MIYLMLYHFLELTSLFDFLFIFKFFFNETEEYSRFVKYCQYCKYSLNKETKMFQQNETLFCSYTLLNPMQSFCSLFSFPINNFFAKKCYTTYITIFCSSFHLCPYNHTESSYSKNPIWG